MLRLLVLLCIAWFVFVTVRNMIRAVVRDPKATPPRPVPPQREHPVHMPMPQKRTHEIEDARFTDLD